MLKLTTYAARHTFARVLKRSGVSTSMISAMMEISIRGHETEKITQTYLDSFEFDFDGLLLNDCYEFESKVKVYKDDVSYRL